MLRSSRACRREQERDRVSVWERENNIILKAITMNSPQFRHESAPLSLTRGEKRGKKRKRREGKKKNPAPWDAYRWVTGDSSPLQGGFYRHDSILGADNAHNHTHIRSNTNSQTHCNLSQCDNERGNEGCVEEWGWVQWGLCWQRGE